MKAYNMLAVAALIFSGMTGISAQTWTQTSAPPAIWQAIASSADGSRLFALGPGSIYGISTNSGATWITNTEPQYGSYYSGWNCIAESADGSTLVAMNANGIWSSTNFGASWFSNTVPGVNFWVWTALAADGTRAVAVDGKSVFGYGSRGGIYTSTNSGMIWSKTTAPNEPWASVASSADGTILAAAALGAPTVPVYVSTNSGVTWAPTPTPTNMECTAVASSADGRKLLVVGTDPTKNSMFYTSTNSGNSWISNAVPPCAKVVYEWTGAASSADGMRLVAVSQVAGIILTSTDSGTTWISNSVPDQLYWLAVASSADGTKLAAVSSDSGGHGVIWTLQTTPLPIVGITQSNSNLGLAWLIPSTHFVLQQNSDLSTTNWSNVPNVPALNLTNLQNQVTVPAPADNVYFRLKAQ